MDRCFLDLQPSSHWGRRNPLPWFPQPLLWPFGSEFCFRRASQIPTRKSHDGMDSRPAQSRLRRRIPNQWLLKKCGVQALPYWSFLCSTVFINIIQFYSIPGPYTILAACGHSVADTGKTNNSATKSSHHLITLVVPHASEKHFVPNFESGTSLLAVCWGKIHPIESNPQNTVVATDALNKTTLIRNTFLQVGTGPLFFSGQQLPYLWIIQINESFSGQVLV